MPVYGCHFCLKPSFDLYIKMVKQKKQQKPVALHNKFKHTKAVPFNQELPVHVTLEL